MEGESIAHVEVIHMSQTSPCWAFGDDVQSLEYYTRQLAEMWPQKLMISGICGSVCSFFHADATLLWVLALTVLADFVVGIFKAERIGDGIDNAKLRRGGLKILLYIVFLLVAGTADVATTRFIEVSSWSLPKIPILNFFLLYFTYTELSSVTRNIEEMGFNVPPLLKSFLGRAKQRVEDEVEKIGPTEEEKKR